jgi:hypothetical protein
MHELNLHFFWERDNVEKHSFGCLPSVDDSWRSHARDGGNVMDARKSR